MSASPRLSVTLAASLALGALFTACPDRCHAQYKNDFDAGFPDVADYQWFEPVDLDLDRQPVRYTSGINFTYDKMLIAITGERTVVGDESVVVNSQVIFPGNSAAGELAAGTIPVFQLPDGSLPQTPGTFQLFNGIRNAGPRAEFGYADRYQIGYVDDDGNGITLGIMTGNEVESEEVFGFGTPSSAGFGSVVVNFRTPPGYLQGFRDFGVEALELDDSISVGTDDDDDGAGVEPTTSGPGGGGADQQIDDILFNGGTFFIIDADMDGVFDPQSDPFYIDFGDLNEFNIRFEAIGTRNVTEIDGVEIMRTHELSNRHFMQKHQNQRLEFAYGARLFRMKDLFVFDGEADLGGDLATQDNRFFAETEVENQIVGPQIRARWNLQRQRLNIAVDGRCLLGYNIGDFDQTFGVGQAFVPGGLNSPLVAAPTYGNNGAQESTFSPVVEFRADVKYQVTRSMALKLGYTAMFVDNITRASQVVDYTLPSIGLKSGGDQDVFINGATFGIEFWH